MSHSTWWLALTIFEKVKYYVSFYTGALPHTQGPVVHIIIFVMTL